MNSYRSTSNTYGTDFLVFLKIKHQQKTGVRRADFGSSECEVGWYLAVRNISNFPKSGKWTEKEWILTSEEF